MKLVESSDIILHTPSELFDVATLDNSQHITDLYQTLKDAITLHNGMGISACQLGINLSAFCIYTDGVYRFCMNPMMIAASIDMSSEIEGCLSYPGLLLKITRPEGVAVRYFNENCKEITEQLEGITARAWLHEYDHVNGICIVDRVSKLSLSIAKRKLAKLNKKDRK